MKERIQEYYFSIVKLVYIFSLVIYSIIINTSSNIDYTKSILQVGMLLMFTAIMVLYEILDKKSFSLLVAASIIGGVLYFGYQSLYSLLIPIIILDLIAYFELPLYFYFLTFIVILQRSENNAMYFIACTCCNIIYFQHYYIVNRYKTLLNDFICNEESLKTSMENQNVKYKNEVERFSFTFENKLLEEKSRLSQALHDKIGHSINGSVYQLEACKLLIQHNPEHSKNIVQAVIDNLRKSLDEIRIILRKEKPSKGEMALLQLWKLCEGFNENYSINAKLTCSGESSEVPEYIWEVILDNSIEAFSNALKYSRCKNINISIAVLNKLVRCAITDDGVGCNNINEGMGLAGMKERTKAVDGNVYVTSNVGFEINMLLPIRHLQKNN